MGVYARIQAEKYTGFILIQVSAGNITPFTALTGANIAQLTFEGSAVRYRLDGISAQSASGHLASANTVLVLHGSDVLQNFNVVSTVPTGTIMASIGFI